MQQAQATRRPESGFAMAALLVAIAVMAVLMSVALPVWKQAAQREKEEELVWRGEQYDRAIQLYRKKNSVPGAPNLDVLVQGKFLRKKYQDPITGGDFELKGPGLVGNLPPGRGPSQPQRTEGQLIAGVRSKSKAKSIRLLNGRDHYDQWEFSYKPWGTKTVTPPGSGRRPGTTQGGGSRPTRPQGASATPDSTP